jgi:O-antigen/teichoic acid export membrane protein
MASRVLRRRVVTAGALYGGTVFGVLGTIVAARILGPDDFGLFTIAFSAAWFFQLLLDTTVEEAVVKYGFRYSEAGDWGRLRRLFRTGLKVKWAGGALAGLAVACLAPFADRLFGSEDLTTPMLVAALVPLAQAPEGIAGASMIVAGRYDLRASMSGLGMVLRLAGLAIGAPFGVTGALLGVLVATAVSSVASGIAGRLVFRYPAAAPAPLGEDRPAVARFVGTSALGTSLVSARQSLAPLLLGLVSIPSQVGFFRTAQAPMTGLEALSAPVRLILLTEQTRDVERGEEGRAYGMLRRYMTGAAVVAVIAAPVFWLLMPTLVDLVYGSDYSGAVEPAQLLLLAACVRLVLGWTKTFPVSIGRPGLRVLAHGVEMAVLVPLILLLGARWDATGAAVAVLVATLAFAGVWALLLVRLRGERRAAAGRPREAL